MVLLFLVNGNNDCLLNLDYLLPVMAVISGIMLVKILVGFEFW